MTSETLLIVDDDPDVRIALEEELADEYSIVLADDAEEGLKKFRSHEISAVISDVRMPGMSGVEFVREVRKTNESVVTILLTGFADESVIQIAHGTPGIFLLAKPWGGELKILLRRAIEQARLRGEWLERLSNIEESRQSIEKVAMSMEKMASLGLLVSGIAHEMRSPLTYLLCNIVYLVEEFEMRSERLQRITALLEAGVDESTLGQISKNWNDADAPGFVAEALEILGECKVGVDRLDSTLMALRRFGGGSKAAKERVNVATCIDDAIKLVLCSFPHGIRFDRSGLGDDLFVEGHPGDLVQVLVNLFQNSAQAMGGRGELTLSSISSEDSLRIRIQDDGPGIDAEKQAHIFDAFFTTKKTEEGTGLGLYIGRGICRQWGGDLIYTGRANQGGEFTIVLPRLVEQSGGGTKTDGIGAEVKYA